jgi:Uma2 family endonuclease
MSAAPDNLLRRHRITVDEYYRMAEVGLLAPDARVELIEGEIIDMAPIGSRHAAVVDDVTQQLAALAQQQATVGAQRPIRLDSGTEPQPDILVLKYRADRYGKSHPGPGDILLLVEVCDASLAYDLKIKLPLYAKHGIPEVWLVDIQNKQLHVFREPRIDHYALTSVSKNGFITMSTAPYLQINVGAVLDLA